MADNVALPPVSGTVATDEAGAAHYQKVKLAVGTADSTDMLPSDATAGLKVDLGTDNDVTVTGEVELGATTLAALETIAVTGPLTDVQIRATALPISVATIPSHAVTNVGVFAAQVTSIAAGNNNIGDVDVASLPALVAGTANIGDVDVLTIAAGDNNIGNVDIVTVPAPLSTTGGGTEAAALRVTVASNSTGLLPVSLASVPSHAVTNAGVFAVQAAMTQVRPATATLTNVADSNVSAQLLASTAGRMGCTIWNDSTVVMYVKFGTTASATSCTYKLAPDQTLEFSQPCYTGRVDGIWASDASGSARITELTA